MARFYQTARPVFVDDKIYTPPWQLAQAVIANKEAQVDQAFAESAFFGEEVSKIQHLNLDSENQAVSSIQERYGKGVEELSRKMSEDVLNSQKYMHEVRDLRNKFQADRSSGDIYNIEQRYLSRMADIEGNKELKEKDPEAYNLVLQQRLQDIRGRLAEDPNATYNGGQIYGRPDITSPENIKLFQDIKANLTSEFAKDADGNVIQHRGRPVYLVNGKQIKEEEVQMIALSKLYSRPGFKGYSQQMAGIQGYEGYGEDLVGEDGRLNGNNPFALDIAGVASAYGFSEMELEETDGGKAAYKYDYDLGLEGYRQKGRLDLELLRQKGDKDKDDRKAAKEKEAKTQAQLVSLPESFGTPEQRAEITNEWFNITRRQQAGQTLSPQEIASKARLDDMYSPIYGTMGTEIIEAFDGKEKAALYKTPEERMNRMVAIIGKLNEAQQAGGLEPQVKLTNAGRGVTSRSYSYTPEQQKILDAQKKLDGIVGDFNDYLTKNMKQATPYATIGDDPVSKSVVSLTSMYTSLMDPAVRPGDVTFTGPDGNPVGTVSVDVDSNEGFFTGAFSRGKTNNPVQAMIEAAGMKSLEELEAAKLVVLSHRPVGNGEMLVKVTPTTSFSEFGNVENSAGDKIPSFTVHMTGVDTKGIYTMGDNPNHNSQYMATQYPEWDDLSTQMNHIEAQKKAGYSKYVQNYGAKGQAVQTQSAPNLGHYIQPQADGSVDIISKNIYSGREIISTVSAEMMKEYKVTPDAAAKLLILNAQSKTSLKELNDERSAADEVKQAKK